MPGSVFGVSAYLEEASSHLEKRGAAPLLGNTKVCSIRGTKRISGKGQEGDTNHHKNQGEESRRMIFTYGGLCGTQTWVASREPAVPSFCLIPGLWGKASLSLAFRRTKEKQL